MATMWDGRFKKGLDAKTNDFNSSISFDYCLYQQDISGSIAHGMMLGKESILSPEDTDAIVKGLKEILADLKDGILKFDPQAEDVHMFIEEELTNRIGEAGKRLHTARSRNDQVALDLKMYLKEEIKEITDLMTTLTETFCAMAEQHLTTIMPGYTHLQPAQPITFAHHLMAYSQMFLRDIQRLKDCYNRLNTMPLGSCALAATTYPINRQYVSDLLGFQMPTQNSLDGVSDRDHVMELASCIAIAMVHLSRFSEEVILWSTWEFKFIELDDGFSTGSSIMPQKKNPDITELIRGKTGRTIGNLTTLLTMMKGLPLAYNKDMQEDKEAIFDSIKTIKLCVSTLIPMVETMTVHKENMRLSAAKGFINATDCADYLTKKGVPFREAHKITGQLVAYCMDQSQVLETLSLAQYLEFSPLFAEDIFEAISLDTCVNNRSVLGGPAPQTVKAQIQWVQKQLQ